MTLYIDLCARADRIPVIYIAGPYSAPTDWQRVQNIRAAEAAAVKVWQAGAAALCPHKNSAHFDGAVVDADPDLFLAGDLAMLARCDAALFLHDWGKSRGAQVEYLFCRRKGVPILESDYDLAVFMAAWSQR